MTGIGFTSTYYGNSPMRFSDSPMNVSAGLNRAGIRYPNPFFDAAQTYFPSSLKQMLRWCRYFFFTNPLINAVVYKLAEYPITDIVYDTKDTTVQDRYRHLFEDQLQIRKFQIEVGLDYYNYGNAFVMVQFPMVKWLHCRHCDFKSPISKLRKNYRFTDLKYYLRCPKCGTHQAARVRDVTVKNPSGIRLVRWDPERIDIDDNDGVTEPEYYYSMPQKLKNSIVIGKRKVIENVPDVFIQALRKKKSVKFARGSLFHLKRPIIAQKDQGWGMPLVLPVLKDIFYLQILRKGQEMIAQEHIVPLRVLFPQPGGESGDPNTMINLSRWRETIEEEVSRWRADPNYIPIMPIPLGHEMIGGQGRALILHQELRVWSEQIIAGMNVPLEFIFGGMQYCLDLDSYVQTSRGLLQLREIVPGESGASLPWPGCVSTDRAVQDVMASHNTGTKKAAVVRTKLGLDAAPSHDHRYRVLNPDLSLSWKRVHELAPGDRVAVRAGANLWPKEAVCISHVAAEAKRQWEDNRKRDTSSRYPCVLPNYLTDELARVLGYLVAEGTCTDPRRFSFGQEDPQVMGDFLDCVEACFGYRPTPTTSTGGTSVEIAREPVVTFLRLLGLVGDSYEKVVPGVVRRAPLQQVSEFLRAYFEGDGSPEDAEEKQTVSCGSVSNRLLKEIQLLLLNMGIVSSRYDDQLQIRSEFVDAYEEHVGFVSDRKNAILGARTPTASTHMAERVPYLKENLDAFRDRHFDGRSSWTFEPVKGLKLLQQTYTVAEAARLLEVDPSTICYHARKGRLTLMIQAQTGDGRFRPRLILRDDLQEFMDEYGRGVRRSIPGRDAWGMTYSKLSGQDLSLIREKEPGLAARIEELAELRYVWDEVRAVDLLDVEAPMGDLTVAVDSSYNADGLVCHNSGSNVSMRILENQFIGYRSDQRRMVRDFIMGRICDHLDWPKVSIKFERFKMADDLQRLMVLFQANQAMKLSDTTFLRELGEDLDVEEERKQSELNRQIESNRHMMVAQAAAQGEANLASLRYELQGQKLQSEVMGPPPGAMGMPAEQGMLPGGEEPVEGGMYEENAGTAPAYGMPPAGAAAAGGQMNGMDIRYVAQRLAAQLRKAQSENPAMYAQYLQRIKMESPQLYQLVQAYLQQEGGDRSPLNPMQQPIPEVKPPRAAPGNTLI